MFARWGRFVYRFRWATLVVSAALLGISLASLMQGGSLLSGGPLTSNLESFQAYRAINSELNRNTGSNTRATTTFDLIFKSDTMTVSDSAYKDAVATALAPLTHDSRVVSILTPYNVSTREAAASLTSRDGHEALVLVEISSTGHQAQNDYTALRGEVSSSTLKIWGTGFLPINQAFNTTLESDLQRAEFVSLPITLLLLILIFATVVAAGLPLGVGLLTIVGGLGAMFFLNRFTDVSQYATNIVTLIGLGVSIDYSLFVVNRFRDELAKGATRKDAIAQSMATAGRAITFSGLTAAVGISAMIFYQGTFMASMGAAGAIVIGVAVLYGLTFLPAILSIVGPAVNWRASSPRAQNVVWSAALLTILPAATGFTLYLQGGSSWLSVGLLSIALGSLLALVGITGRFGRRRAGAPAGRGFWAGLANWVMKRPVLVLLPTVTFLVVTAIPFSQLRMANGSVDMLPPRIESRQGFDRLTADFPGQDETTLNIVVNYPAGNPLTRDRIAAQYALDRRIASMPGVLHTSSIYDVDPSLGLYDYEQMYLGNHTRLPAAVQTALAGTVGKHIVLINATSNYSATSDAARNLVKAIRADQGVGDGGQVWVGGETAVDIDVIRFIIDRTPLAVGIVVLITYLLLFLQTGSVVLPLKAVILNFLSIGASFGALVFIFQQGHFSNILGFTPQSLDPSIPVILFSIVFGLSMDYEVLLVSRIHEEYVRTGNNTLAVANGLERTGRLITGAAAIMFAVFMSFGLAEVVIIKAIGIGLAIAVAIDATIVRSLVVPAVMRLLGHFNWWAPRPLRRLHRKIGLGDLGVEEAPARRRPVLEPMPAPVPAPASAPAPALYAPADAGVVDAEPVLVKSKVGGEVA